MADEQIDDVGSGAGGNADNTNELDRATGDATVAGLRVESPANSEPAKRSRGRPAGSGGKRAGSSGGGQRGEKASQTAVSGVEKILFSLHQMASQFLPELAIEREESKMLAESLADVSAFYNQVVDPKLVAWIGLAGVVGKLYGPRVMAYKMRKMIEKKNRPKSTAPNVPNATVQQKSTVQQNQPPSFGDFVSLPEIE